MTEAPIWSCSFSDGEGVKLDSLTVGAKFGLKCHGDIPVDWSDQPLTLKFPKEDDAYTLVILNKKNLTAQDAEFEVTSYKAGSHQPDYVRVLQGEKGFEITKPAWTVQSVLKQGEQPKPYPSFGPYMLSLPMWILIVAGVTLVALSLIIWRIVRRYRQRKRMLEDLKRHRTALSPLHQFYRDARGLRRRLHTAQTEDDLRSVSRDLSREFRLYVLRTFEIPTLDWSDGEILKDLKRRYRKVHRRGADPLKRTLRELTRLVSQPKLGSSDVEQMHRMSLDTAERLERAREEGRR